MVPVIRRVESHEWQRIRALRLEALADDAAPIAFLRPLAEEAAFDDAFWKGRAAGAASGDTVAQFVAIDAERWVGTLTVLVQPGGAEDYNGRMLDETRASVVGVYVAPEARGAGVIDALFAMASGWASERGHERLHLEVHEQNVRAQQAYRRAGFTPRGLAFTGVIGPEIEMVLPVDPPGM